MELFLNLVSDVVGNAGVILVIMGLVEFLRQFGLRDNYLRATSMAVGIVFGGGAIVAANGNPVGFANVFYVVLAGILFGLVASGIVDLTGRLIVQNVSVANTEPEVAIAENA